MKKSETSGREAIDLKFLKGDQNWINVISLTVISWQTVQMHGTNMPLNGDLNYCWINPDSIQIQRE